MSELQCVHGVGHSVDTHGCDGCCLVFGKVAEERIIKLLEEMRDACLSVTSKIGDHNAFTLENAIALINVEKNPHVRAETEDFKIVLEQTESKSARSCGCKKED